MYVQDWAQHSELQRKAKAKADHPLSIAFAVELSEDVVPFQQCTDARVESNHLGPTVKRPQWARDPATSLDWYVAACSSVGTA